MSTFLPKSVLDSFSVTFVNIWIGLIKNNFILGNYVPVPTLPPDSQIIDDDNGNVQDALASLLPTGQAFYVNAQSTNISYPYLFEYSPDSASDNTIFHFSPSPQGSCLTYSKSNDGATTPPVGMLESKGRYKIMP